MLVGGGFVLHPRTVRIAPVSEVSPDGTADIGSGRPMAVTVYGVVAVTFMITMYALERRGRRFVAAFAAGCVLSSVYGFLSGAWPLGVVELLWAGVAVHRYRQTP